MVKVAYLGLFIKEHLQKVGEDYIQNMWREYKKWAVQNGLKPCKYSSFRAYLWQLKKLGLIKLVKTESSWGHDKHYYALEKRKLNHEGWKDPLKARGLRKRKKQKP